MAVLHAARDCGLRREYPSSEFEGNTDLTKEVIDAYYAGMPEAIGFVNGYGPGYTFTTKNGRPCVSYDYYLSPRRPEGDAVADLQLRRVAEGERHELRGQSDCRSASRATRQCPAGSGGSTVSSTAMPPIPPRFSRFRRIGLSTWARSSSFIHAYALCARRSIGRWVAAAVTLIGKGGA